MAYELKTNEVDKKGALEILDVKERTLANYVSDGRLQARYEKGKTSKIAVYFRADVEALKNEIDDPTKAANSAKVAKSVEVANVASPATAANSSQNTSVKSANTATLAKLATPELNGVGQFSEFAATLSAHFAAAIAESTHIQNLAVQPLLTFADAALFTGLSERSLRQAAKEGKLAAKRQGRADRILRTDLDAYLRAIMGK